MTVAGPLASRRKVVQVKLETDRGTAVTPDLPALCFDPVIQAGADYIARRPAGASGGSIQGFLGARVGTISLRMEMMGSGSAVTLDPCLAALLQCCGFKLATGVYAPCHPVDQKTCTISVHQDGTLKQLHGCAGNVKIEGEWGKPAYANFDLKGIWQAPTDVALPAVSLPTVVAPPVKACTFTLDGVTPYIPGFSFDMGAKVEARESIAAPEGVLHYYVADRDPVITLSPEAQTVAAYDWFGKWTAYTQLAFSLLVGSATNNKFTLAAPKLQIRSPKEGDRNGRLVHEIDCLCCTNAGDDEVTITPG